MKKLLAKQNLEAKVGPIAKIFAKLVKITVASEIFFDFFDFFFEKSK